MTEIERIEDQLKRSLEGEAWHGPALEELLADVTAEQAAALWSVIGCQSSSAGRTVGFP